jgi:hypothetical protein
LVCAGNVSYEREKGLEAAMRAMGVPLWAHWSGHAFVCALLLGTAALFCGATVTSFGKGLSQSPHTASLIRQITTTFYYVP